MRRSLRVGSVLALVVCLGALASCRQEKAAAPAAPPAAAPAPPPAAAPAPPAAAPAPAAGQPPASEFRVVRIDIGSAIDAEKRITSPTALFKPTDTIYAALTSEGSSPSVTMIARWTFEDGQPVGEGSQVIAPSGPAVTEFHISRPSPWPPGRYQLEVLANGAPAGMRTFEVKE